MAGSGGGGQHESCIRNHLTDGREPRGQCPGAEDTWASAGVLPINPCSCLTGQSGCPHGADTVQEDSSPEARSSPFTSSVDSWGLSPGPGTPHLSARWHESATPWACTVLSKSPSGPRDHSRDWNGRARAAHGEPLLKPRCIWLRSGPTHLGLGQEFSAVGK